MRVHAALALVLLLLSPLSGLAPARADDAAIVLTASTGSHERAIDLAWTWSGPAVSFWHIDLLSCDSCSPTTIVTTQDSAARSFSVGMAANGQTYSFRVWGELGSSTTPRSNVASATTIPFQPVTITAANAGFAGAIHVQWNDPNIPATFWHVQMLSCDGCAAVDVGAISDAAARSFTMGGLRNGQTYAFQVYAESPGGPSPMSNQAAATTTAFQPVSATAATAATAGAINVNWSDPNIPATFWHVQMLSCPGCAPIDVGAISDVSARSFTMGGLRNGQTYAFQVYAESAGGPSPISNQVSATTIPFDAPILGATGGPEPRTVTLTWAEPTVPASGWHVQELACSTCAPVDLAYLADGSARSYVVGGLANAQTVLFDVWAESPGGVSPSSNVATATTLDFVAPALTASQGARPGDLVLSWGEPTLAATAWHVKRADCVTSCWTELAVISDPAARSFAPSGLLAGSSYTFELIEEHDGRLSDPRLITAVATPFAAPTITAQASATTDTITLTLAPPAGMSPTQWHIDRTGPSGVASFALAGGTASYVDRNLVNNVTYLYTVRYDASGGSSAPGTASATTTPFLAVPMNATISAPYRSILLSWGTPNLAATRWHVERSNGSGFVEIAKLTASARSYSDATVVAGATYAYRVHADSIGGPSDPSLAPSVYVPRPPSAPQQVTPALMDGGASVQLSWLAPADPGDSGIVSYTIFRGDSTGGEMALATIGTNTTFVDRALDPGAHVWYVVLATNAHADGPKSAEHDAATTQIASGDIVVGDPAGLAVCNAGDCVAPDGPADGIDAHVLRLGHATVGLERMSVSSTDLTGLGSVTLTFFADAGNAPGSVIASDCSALLSAEQACTAPAGAAWVSIESNVGALTSYTFTAGGFAR